MGQRYTTRLEQSTSCSPSTSLSLCWDSSFLQNILSLPTRCRQVYRGWKTNRWEQISGWLSGKTSLHEGNGMKQRHLPKQMPLKANGFFFLPSSMSCSSHPTMYHLALLLRVWMILSLCLQTARLFRNRKESRSRHHVLTTLQSWNWDSVPGKGLHTVWGAPFWSVRGRQIIARSAYMCIGTNGGETVTMPGGYSCSSQYGQQLPVPRVTSTMGFSDESLTYIM